MAEDIRDKPFIDHQDILRLNFIRDPGPYVFRRYPRHGLRSHILEVLDPHELERERTGIVIEGIRWFPRARPLKMLRIFRTGFPDLGEALEEIGRVKIVERYLAPEYLATSNEFLVDYQSGDGHSLILCGLQEYVEGEVLDPWRHLDARHLAELLRRMNAGPYGGPERDLEARVRRVQKRAEGFVGRIKKMILETHYVPDLAGVQNLLLTPRGGIKLVDINNISEVRFGRPIDTDDKGYPICDKSIEALALLEEKLLARPIDREETLYRIYLDPQRVKAVAAIQEAFHLAMEKELPAAGAS
jgi:hypothetical protein